MIARSSSFEPLHAVATARPLCMVLRDPLMTPAPTSLATPGTVSSECSPRSTLSSKTPSLGMYEDGVPTPICIVEPSGTSPFKFSAIALVSAEGSSIPSCLFSLFRSMVAKWGADGASLFGLTCSMISSRDFLRSSGRSEAAFIRYSRLRLDGSISTSLSMPSRGMKLSP